MRESAVYIWAVFDADGCECETLSAVFGSREEAEDFAARLNASAEAEYEELYRDSHWKPTIKRIITVRSLELGKEPDISSTLELLRENRRTDFSNQSATSSTQVSDLKGND